MSMLHSCVCVYANEDMYIYMCVRPYPHKFSLLLFHKPLHIAGRTTKKQFAAMHNLQFERLHDKRMVWLPRNFFKMTY